MTGPKSSKRNERVCAVAPRPLSRQTLTAGVIVAMLTVPLAPVPAMAGVDLLGGDDDSEEEDSSDGSGSDEGEGSDDEDTSDSSEGGLLSDVVKSVTGGSEPERQAAADGSEPQEVTPPSQDDSQQAPQPQDDGGSQAPQDTSAPEPSGQTSSGGGSASSGAASASSQPAAPSGPRRATRPRVQSDGQPPASSDGPAFDSIDRGAYQPRAPEVLNEGSNAPQRSDVAALPSLRVSGEASDSGAAEVPNELVAAASALLVILGAAHSLHATRRFGSDPDH